MFLNQKFLQEMVQDLNKFNLSKIKNLNKNESNINIGMLVI